MTLLAEQKKLAGEQELADSAVRTAGQNLTETGTDEAAKRAKAEELRSSLPYPGEKEARDVLERLRAEAEPLKQRVQAHKDALSAAEKALAKAEGALRTAEASLPEAEKAAETAAGAYMTALRDNGFADETAYEEALLPMGGADGERWLKEQDRRLTDYDRSLAAAKQTADSLAGETEGWVPEDLEELREQLAGAETAAAEADRAWADLSGTAGNHRRTLERVRDALTELRRTDSACKRLTNLSKTANGELGDNGRMTFERYVMSSVFREVLEKANERLAAMSGKRYELRYIVQDKGRSTSQSGLGIEVYDHTTDKARGTGSLSGGEGFITSMALALGMSDVVQEHAGGASMDALFIDEGFGTLDNEVLDTALRVLQELAHGSRLVGVISHVEKLGEDITDRIKVSSDEHGSHLTVQT